MKKIATLQEIETHWSIVDLSEAHEVLDYIDHVQAKKQKIPKKRGR